MNITDSTTVADIAAALPSSIRVFQQHGIDFCCGGKTRLAAACEAHGVPFAEVVAAIQDSARTPQADQRDWTVSPLHQLADHIVARYHGPLREELPRLESMAAKVCRVHGARAAYLVRLEAVVSELSAELRTHMRKEELVLFPAIRAIERGTPSGVRIDAPIAVMEHEHDQAGTMLGELRAITGGYIPPEWACQTFRALYHGLSELDAAMHVHVHLENNILFPRALALADAAA